MTIDLISSEGEEFLSFVQQSLDCRLVQTTNAASYLSLKENALSFHSQNFKNPLIFDPTKGQLGYRLKRSEQEGLLKKALGNVKPGSVILDATAGLMKDSLIFDSLGYRVIAIEQSKILGTILSVSQKANPDLSKIEIRIGQSENMLSQLHFDVIYFDPMFEKVGTALRERNLRLIKEILAMESIHQDNQLTFEKLYQSSYQKLIVKRPIKSKPFSENFNYQIKGRSVRYDVYV